MAVRLGTREASERYGVTIRTLYRLIDEGKLPAYKMGRVIRLREKDLRRYFTHGRNGGGRNPFPLSGPPSGDGEPRKPAPGGSSGSSHLRLYSC